MIMFHRTRLVGSLTAIVLAAWTAAAGARAIVGSGDAATGVAVVGVRQAQRQIVATVLDQDRAPVTTLDAADFTVREDGLAREIIAVGAAPLATHVVLLVDDSQATRALTVTLREALTAFVDVIASAGSTPMMRLATFGDRPTTRVDFTPSAGLMMQGIDTLFPRPNSGSTFLEAILETADDLHAQDAERSAIVAFVAESGPEFSDERHERIAEALREAGAALWAVVLEDRFGQDQSPNGRERAIVLGDVTTESGGFTRPILSREGIAVGFEMVAAALTSGYAITYGRPDSLIPPSALEVTVRDPELQVVASQWADQ